MRYWFDTEFMEDSKTIDLLSIAIVAEDGREFYAEVSDADYSKANDWVKQNVIPLLWCQQSDKSKFNAWSRDGGIGGLLTRKEIAQEVKRFLAPDKPEIWAYYADYDWVVFCQLFGTMKNLPEGYPMMCLDLKQLIDATGVNVPKQQDGEHNALDYARWVRDSWNYLLG